ncbi:MAG: hypothetical protein EOQ39_18520 [Mesorhizobium sp.]|uniref:hypothetical protein n=1 Tax=Mesorhizobium sp. TaxID=1871066 RepID=UPI000FE94AA0|nr:hypothetical protein [Mesorhizobium sp.]RWB08832.1 MAG: hypothetical protein EOQ37_04825 [Mesorhizobium sp.]RWB13518.1 MAG: hypothetical protein EOQ39_18520 [Mesorhizobium sp.]
MRVNSVQHETRTGSLGETSAFKVEMNAMMFHTVMNGVYPDKIKAPFRELATNARDSHATKGNLDQSIDVFLPSVLDPTFKVRDYGTSLSHEEITGIYSTMFASSKRDDNGAVGMIGLGSKSPFAYGSVFTVVAYLGDYKRTYAAYLDSDDFPQISLLDMSETSEPDGIEVSFPVKIEDVARFRAIAPDVLFGFDPFPNILNETFVRPEPVILYQGDGWTLYDKTTVPFGAKLMARQGCVLYPISPASLSITSNLFNWAVVIDFPIGELSVTTSREDLGYDSRTVATLTKRIEDTVQGMAALLQDEVNTAGSYLEACNIYAEGLDYGSAKKELFELVGAHLTWKGKPLRKTIRCRSHWHGAHGAELLASKGGMGQLRKSVAHRANLATEVFNTPKSMMETLVCVEFEGTRFGPSRMRQVIADNVDKKDILWIRATDATTVAPFIEGLGDPEWTDLALVEPLKWDNGPKTETKRLQYLSPATHAHRQYDLTTAYDTVVPNDEMFFVKQDSAEFEMNGKTMNKVQLSNRIHALMKAEVIPRGERVYLLNKTAQKILDDVDMIELGPFVVQKLADMVDATTLRLPEDRWRTEDRVEKCGKILKAEVSIPAEIESVCRLVVHDATVPKATVTSSDPLMVVFKEYHPLDYVAATQRADPVVEAYHNMLQSYPLLSDTISYPTKFNHYMELLTR